MKLKSTITINMGLYMDIRPEIEIDTDNLEEAKELIKKLHDAFYGLLNGKPKNPINEELQLAGQKLFKKEISEVKQKHQLDYDLDLQHESDQDEQQNVEKN